MSGVTFRIEQQSDKKVVLYLKSVTPRMFLEVSKVMRAYGYQGASLTMKKYFAASQSVERGARNTGSVLISRHGTLRGTVGDSVEPGYSETDTTITQVWGAATPYARIQEKGGYAGRNHRSYIPPRPYLAPAQAELTPELLASIQQAVEKALAAK